MAACIPGPGLLLRLGHWDAPISHSWAPPVHILHNMELVRPAVTLCRQAAGTAGLAQSLQLPLIQVHGLISHRELRSHPATLSCQPQHAHSRLCQPALTSAFTSLNPPSFLSC